MDVLLPSVGRGPAVLVAHPWWGLNDTIRAYGASLAEAGFVVGLPDVFIGEIVTQIDDAEKLIRKHWEAAGSRLTGPLRELLAHHAVTGTTAGAVGFSFGGYHLLEAIADPGLPLNRLVTYYATHSMPERHVPVLAHFAEDDPFESAADMAALSAALKSAGPPNASHYYAGTKHWFAEADRPEYDSAAAKLAFERTVAFLRG